MGYRVQKLHNGQTRYEKGYKASEVDMEAKGTNWH